MNDVEIKAAEYGLMEKTTQHYVGTKQGTANGPFSVQQCLLGHGMLQLQIMCNLTKDL